MGSMYHGNNGAGGQDQNNIKSIITKSGHVLEFNDTNNSESITIKDKKGNLIIIDTAGETITINALKDLNINAGENLNITAGKNIMIYAGDNIDETAGQNITTNAGKNLSISATGNITETSDNRTEQIDKVFSRTSEISNEVAGEVSLFSEKESMTLQSAKTVEFNSVEKSNLF
ncbi:Vgr family protein, partial [Tenacibaculum finnmarkense]|nr:Vgr family protein [Tenacibaculum finnmarkense]